MTSSGGTGGDVVNYGARATPTSVTHDNQANDGQINPSENDDVDNDIGSVILGSGNDVAVVNGLGATTPVGRAPTCSPSLRRGRRHCESQHRHGHKRGRRRDAPVRVGRT